MSDKLDYSRVTKYNMLLNYEFLNMKKIALITGITRGIGRQVASQLFDKGYEVHGIYKDSDEIARELDRLGYFTYKVNLEKKTEISRFTKSFIKKVSHIDVLINNAGIYLSDTVLDETSISIDRVVSTNLMSKIHLTSQLLPLLIKGQGKKIVMLSSRFGFEANLDELSFSYCLASCGTNLTTHLYNRSLSQYGIKTTCIIPTVTNTDRFKEGFSKEEQEFVIEKGWLADAQETARMIVEDRKSVV